MTGSRGQGEREEGRQPVQIRQWPELVGVTELTTVAAAAARRRAAVAEAAAMAMSMATAEEFA